MRNIFVLLITVSLLGMVTCSSDGTSSITSPSALPPDNSSPATENGVCSQGDCQFGAVPYPGAASRWHGEAEPDSIPSLGHPGHLTVNFPKSFYWGVTLKWAKFHHGAKAECTITNNVNSWSYVVPDHCGTGEGTLVVVPPYTPSGVVEYTFTDKENPEQSADQWQVAKVKVTLPTQVTDITATWEPRTGYNMEDPTQMYRGTATGPLNNLTVDLMDPVHVHCGLGGGGEYVHLRAQMSLNSNQQFVGSYDGNTYGCRAAKGTFTLAREQ